MTNNPADEWPCEPWVVSGPGDIPPGEIGSIFQEGEVDVIVQVDPENENPDAYVQATARRICGCVNAMAGIEDPEAIPGLLRNVRDRFREYAAHHAAKPDAEKAKRNSDMADMIDAALGEITNGR